MFVPSRALWLAPCLGMLVSCAASRADRAEGDGTSGRGALGVDDLPAACPLFTREIARLASSTPIDGEGMETIAGEFRQCVYEHGSPGVVIGQIGHSDGSPEDYRERCAEAAAGVRGHVVEGVGEWACFWGSDQPGAVNILGTGDGTFEVSVTGDVSEKSLEEAARALLAALP